MLTEEEVMDKIDILFTNLYKDRRISSAMNEYELLELNFYWDYLELIAKNKTEDDHRRDCEHHKAFRRELLRMFRKYGLDNHGHAVEKKLKKFPNLIVKCSIEKCDINNCEYNYHKTINNY